MRTIDQAELHGKRVLCRIDADIPFDEQGTILDDNRIRVSLPTIDAILQAKPARLILIAHRGRPKGFDASLTLEAVAHYLAEHYGSQGVERQPKQFAAALDLFKITNALYLTENVRFMAEETGNDPGFAGAMATEGDIFIFDAFADAHRSHASTVGVSAILPSFAGLRVIEEVKHLDKLRTDPAQPVVFMIGGVKIEDKLPVIQNLVSMTDRFLIGGAVANTFLKASGMDVQQSLVQDQYIDEARKLIEQLSDKLVLPTDYTWEAGAIVDIGPRTILAFEDALTSAATVFWNGNVGKTEERQFRRGSLALADFLARSTEKIRVVAGGDTVGFLNEHDLAAKMTFVSTGGGATLDYLAGKELPALVALQN